MKLVIAFVGMAFLAGCSGVPVQEEQNEPLTQWGDDPMSNPEFMAAWTASSTPGEAHARFARAAGAWDVESVMYVQPGAPGTPSKASATSRTILGGRYLLEEFKGDAGGIPFEGMLLLGYDNLAEEYVSVWVDTMSTWPSIARGKENDKGEVVQIGTMYDVITPQGRPYEHVSWEKGDDELHAKMYDTLPDGTEWVVMEMTYKRKK
jgi:hypothetical protein